MDGVIRSVSKAWIQEFLFVRGMISGPDGSPLYQYHVTDNEYSELPSILCQSFRDIESPSYLSYWSAVFCLFVSEKYRREYDGASLGWSWSGFEEPLNIIIPGRLHGEIVKRGLAYWKRIIRHRTNGCDYLGSLFDEGGLPWRLVQSETHGFGRAVRGGVTKYYRAKQHGDDVVSIISSYSDYFPQTFRTHDKYLLIGSIVEWLMALAEAYPISTVEDPADYLDKNAPDWRRQSPLPVSESNARKLINEWLKDAGKSRCEKRKLEADERNFTCDHWLKGTYESWVIETEVFLPSEIKIKLEDYSIKSTRVEIAFYEGESLLTRSGIAHGKVSDDRFAITVKINSRAISVIRTKPELPLTVQFLSNGHRIHACYFEKSEIDYTSFPMVFVEEGEQLKLISTASVTIPAQHAVVRVPPVFKTEFEADISILGEDQLGGKWISVASDIALIGSTSLVMLRFDANAVIVKPALIGTMALYDTLPNLVYRGWPIIKSGGGVEEGREIEYLANGLPYKLRNQRNEVGSYRFTALGASGEILLEKKVGIIPRDLSVTSLPASSSSNARIILKSNEKFSAKVIDENLKVDVEETSDGCVIKMEALLGKQVPQQVRVALIDAVHPGEPVVLKLPFPNVGVRIFYEEGEECLNRSISLDQLIETSMTLTPRPDTNEKFFISLELICQHIPNFRRYYPFAVNRQAQKINLYAFQEDIEQMLGTTNNQDAFVRIRVETDRILKQVDVVRYNGRIEGPGKAGTFEVVSDNLVASKAFVRVAGMRLDDPMALPIDIVERASQGVGVGLFEIPPKMMKKGPWLLFPPPASSVKFRPTLWVNESSVDPSEDKVVTLHAAAKKFHPIHNPYVFEAVISSMAEDLSHSGWDYLRSLKQDYGTLPLSAFESWKALTSNSVATAVAVFRLEFDPLFCRRLSNELAVIWETVNVQTWIKVRLAHRSFLIGQGLPEELSERLVNERVSSVATAIPCFLYLSDYLREPKSSKLKKVPYDFARICFEDLRRNHADDQRWPEWLKVELTNWIRQQNLPDEIKTLPDVAFSRAVAFLPVFMAAVTAGNADFTDLTDSLPELRFAVRVLSDFDRDAWYEPTYSLVLSNLLLELAE